MATKLRAAKKVGEYGISTLILNGERTGLLPTVLGGGPGGSLFLARERRLNSRKHWIAFTLRSRGQVHLDQGAVDALTNRGKSLLASGVLRVMGSFEAGDPVGCVDIDGKEFARGLVNVSSDLLRQMKGLKTADIHEQFGLQEYEEVIHRDNLAIL
jgi:glutamate 5-kinase